MSSKVKHIREDLKIQKHPNEKVKIPPKIVSGILVRLAVRPTCPCIFKPWKDSKKKQRPLP